MALTRPDWTQIKNKPYFDVRDYGAKGDGSTDDTASIQAALDAGAGAGVFFPAGSYKITDTLTVSSGTHVMGVHRQSVILPYITTAGTLNCLESKGTYSDPLSSTVTINADYPNVTSETITVADSSSISADDYVTIYDRETTGYATELTQQTRVVSSVGGVITTYDPIMVPNVTTHNLHYVRKFTPNTDITIENLAFDGTNVGGTAYNGSNESEATFSRGVYLEICANCTVRSCVFENFTQSAALMTYVGYNLVVDDIETHNCGTGYEADVLSTGVSSSVFNNIRSFMGAGVGPMWQNGVNVTVQNVISSHAVARGIKVANMGRSQFSNLFVNNPGTVGLAINWSSFRNVFRDVCLVNCPANYGSLWIEANNNIYNVVDGLTVVGSNPYHVSFDNGAKYNRVVNIHAPEDHTDCIRDQDGSNFFAGPLNQWIDFTLLNSWAAVAGFATPGYRVGEDGSVRLRGAISTGTTGTVFAALPNYLTPTFKQEVRILGGTANDAIALVSVAASSPNLTCVTNKNTEKNVLDGVILYRN